MPLSLQHQLARVKYGACRFGHLPVHNAAAAAYFALEELRTRRQAPAPPGQRVRCVDVDGSLPAVARLRELCGGVWNLSIGSGVEFNELGFFGGAWDSDSEEIRPDRSRCAFGPRSIFQRGRVTFVPQSTRERPSSRLTTGRRHESISVTSSPSRFASLSSIRGIRTSTQRTVPCAITCTTECDTASTEHKLASIPTTGSVSTSAPSPFQR